MTSIAVEKAKQLCKKSDTEPLILGDKWCLVSHQWWMNFVESTENATTSTSLELPPISNANLTEKLNNGNYELKPKMVESLDFNLVPETVFDELVNAFGVECEPRDIIKREVIEGTLMDKTAFVEIYPLEIKIANFSKKDQVVTLKVSLSETIEGIRDKAMEALKMPESSRRIAKFFVEENAKYESLFSMAKFKLHSLLTSNSVIYIDEAGTGVTVVEPKPGDYNGNRRYGYNSNISTSSNEHQQLGLCGLQNLGNTCFMNSALQCLSNVPELTEYFLKGVYNSEINFENPLGTQGKLVRAYAEMIQEMWAGTTSTVRPNRLKSVIGQFAPRFNGYAQQDSQELTSFLLDGLHEDLNRIKVKPYIEEKESDGRPDSVVAEEAWANYKKRNNSIIVDLLHGQLKSTLVCPVCTKVSVKFDPFCFLSVPVPAKERLVKSTIVHVRSKKWAKFAISHTTKTSVGKALEEIKSNLKLDPSTRLVLVSTQGEIFREESALPSMQYSSYTSKPYFAYAVDPGNVATVENKSLSAIDRTLSVPMAMNLAVSKISKQYVYGSVLPVVKELFWRLSEEGDEGIGVEDGKKEKDAACAILPAEIFVYCDGQLLSFPADPTEEIDVQGYSSVRIVLKWAVNQFQQFNLDTIVDRELNLSTPVKKSYTLNECVDLFTSEEQLSEDDSWYCPTCKKHERAFKKLDLWSLPQILIVQLKRFQYSRYSREKIDTPIVVPVKGLDLTDKLADPNNRMLKYDLIAVNNHCGGLGSGHYTAKALNNGHWCDFNDSSACVSTDLNEPFSTHEGYILYYRRQPMVEGADDRPKRLSSSSASSQITVNSSGTNGNSLNTRNSSASKRRISESKMEID